MAEEQAQAAEQPAAGGKKGLIVTILVAIIALAGGAGGAVLFMGGAEPAADGAGVAEQEDEAEAPAELPEAHYFSLDPAFVVNFQSSEDQRGRARFLQITIDGMTRDELVLDAVRKHTPVIRNNLVLLFSQQTYEGLLSPESKEALREQALAEIQKVLQQEIGQPGVEAVFFTSFVMQ